MALPSKAKYDIAVIGAGFSGSLTALCLQQIGYKVILIEKGSHPRFAVGESSTPIADMILRALSNRYNLPWLHKFSRYGSWQDSHPKISCGLKRGFSYYRHQKGQAFQTDQHHSNELLVAASVNDRQSDTNWYRRDIDAFLIKKVKEAGIAYYDNTKVEVLNRLGQWHIEAYQNNKSFKWRAGWIIDATGSSDLLEKLEIDHTADELRTRSSALFSHFRGVKPWQEWLLEKGIPDDDYPYNPDHSALHHLLDEGWLWMLRFNNGITSAGFVFNDQLPEKSQDPVALWEQITNSYPSLADLFKNAAPADEPGRILQTGRLQRKAKKAVDEGYIALPHTTGFVDPLHSTGIAHSLSGVERILYAFEAGRNNSGRIKLLQGYNTAVLNELEFIDLLVSGCYKAMPHFELFNIFTMLYFIAAIDYEQKRLRGVFEIEQHQFLSANHSHIPLFTNKLYRDLLNIVENGSVTDSEVQTFRKSVEEVIEPYNIAGLLRPAIPNMYEHTAAEM